MKRMNIPLERKDCERLPWTIAERLVYGTLAGLAGIGLGLLYMGAVNYYYFAKG